MDSRRLDPTQSRAPCKIQWPTHSNYSSSIDVYLPGRVIGDIAIDTRPVDQPERVRLQIPARRGIVVAHPVLVQAGFGLEPLAGKAQGDGGAGGGADLAEGQVGGGPGLDGGGVGGKDRADEVDHPALDHGEGHAFYGNSKMNHR